MSYKYRIFDNRGFFMLANLINGISLGSVYAIIALGYTMVYGIAKMLNFAHGDVIMVGGYISFCSITYLPAESADPECPGSDAQCNRGDWRR